MERKIPVYPKMARKQREEIAKKCVSLYVSAFTVDPTVVGPNPSKAGSSFEEIRKYLDIVSEYNEIYGTNYTILHGSDKVPEEISGAVEKISASLSLHGYRKFEKIVERYGKSASARPFELLPLFIYAALAEVSGKSDVLAESVKSVSEGSMSLYLSNVEDEIFDVDGFRVVVPDEGTASIDATDSSALFLYPCARTHGDVSVKVKTPPPYVFVSNAVDTFFDPSYVKNGASFSRAAEVKFEETKRTSLVYVSAQPFVIDSRTHVPIEFSGMRPKLRLLDVGPLFGTMLTGNLSHAEVGVENRARDVVERIDSIASLMNGLFETEPEKIVKNATDIAAAINVMFPETFHIFDAYGNVDETNPLQNETFVEEILSAVTKSIGEEPDILNVEPLERKPSFEMVSKLSRTEGFAFVSHEDSEERYLAKGHHDVVDAKIANTITTLEDVNEFTEKFLERTKTFEREKSRVGKKKEYEPGL